MLKARYYTLLILAILPINSFAKAASKSMPAVLKADRVDGDREKNVIDAIGNVELTKDGNTLFADKISYNKDAGKIDAYGNIRIQNYDIGNVYAGSANVKSDLKSGVFKDATLVFNDGSYLKAPKITRDNEFQTTLNHPTFSICPNEEIEKDNSVAGDKRDAISIASQKTVINKKDEVIKNKHSVIKLYNVPVFYVPYLSMPTPASTRKSGFLHPSYVNSTKLGAGVKLPYYFNLAPNYDLTTTAQYHPSGGHFILTNNYRHLLRNGGYVANLDLANNRPKENNIGNNGITNQEARWYLVSKGNLKTSDRTTVDFDIDNVGDRNYLRDYRNSFSGYKVSQTTFDYIDDKDYASLSGVRIQELEIGRDPTTSPLALPILNYYKEFKPHKGKISPNYGLLLNSTTIARQSGLQYRRVSAKPEIKLPYNLSGNLFEAAASLQGDFYNLDSNFTGSNTSNNFDHNTFNYRPEASVKWSLPMVRKFEANTVIIEPLVNIATGTFKNNFGKIPNEDSQNTELTQSNLFLSDRFSGFDRNETGHRINYGAKSSFFNDDFGQLNFGLGQSWRKGGKTQDVQLRGFNDSNKSNIVGEIGYKSLKSFSIIYNFQLNESSYRNDINEITTNLNFKRFSLGANYILLRRTANNFESRKQLNLESKFNITKKISLNISNNRDLVLDRNITRKYGLMYDGCCVSYGIFISEENPTAIASPQKSYNINFAIKNL